MAFFKLHKWVEKMENPSLGFPETKQSAGLVGLPS